MAISKILDVEVRLDGSLPAVGPRSARSPTGEGDDDGPDPCADRLTEWQEKHIDERRRIARDLHDRVGQGVAVAQQNLELYSAYAEKDPVRAGLRITVAQEALRSVIDSIRELTSSLRATKPVEGIGNALKSYVDSMSATGVRVRMRVSGDDSVAPSYVREEILLVIQEALRNAIVHAHPRSVLVRVDIAPNELRATVDDDGIGMDFGLIGRAIASGGGLGCMQERAALLGGTVTISSHSPTGTRVELRVPMDERRDADHG